MSWVLPLVAALMLAVPMTVAAQGTPSDAP